MIYLSNCYRFYQQSMRSTFPIARADRRDSTSFRDADFHIRNSEGKFYTYRSNLNKGYFSFVDSKTKRVFVRLMPSHYRCLYLMGLCVFPARFITHVLFTLCTCATSLTRCLEELTWWCTGRFVDSCEVQQRQSGAELMMCAIEQLRHSFTNWSVCWTCFLAITGVYGYRQAHLLIDQQERLMLGKRIETANYRITRYFQKEGREPFPKQALLIRFTILEFYSRGCLNDVVGTGCMNKFNELDRELDTSLSSDMLEIN